jgi:hypothetical protein
VQGGEGAVRQLANQVLGAVDFKGVKWLHWFGLFVNMCYYMSWMCIQFLYLFYAYYNLNMRMYYIIHAYPTTHNERRQWNSQISVQ